MYIDRFFSCDIGSLHLHYCYVRSLPNLIKRFWLFIHYSQWWKCTDILTNKRRDTYFFSKAFLTITQEIETCRISALMLPILISFLHYWRRENRFFRSKQFKKRTIPPSIQIYTYKNNKQTCEYIHTYK